MAKFTVKIEETFTKNVVIDAETKEAALEKAKQKHEVGYYDLPLLGDKKVIIKNVADKKK